MGRIVLRGKRPTSWTLKLEPHIPVAPARRRILQGAVGEMPVIQVMRMCTKPSLRIMADGRKRLGLSL